MARVWFSDTNVLVPWAMTHGGLLDWFTDRFHLPEDIAQAYRDRHAVRAAWVEAVLAAQKANHPDEFYLSHLTTNEVFKALKDELLSIMMFRNGVPISVWPRPQHHPVIGVEEQRGLFEQVSRLFDKLLSAQRKQDAFTFIPESTPMDKAGYWDAFASLLFDSQGTEVMDVTLLVTAAVNGADYFVTDDDRLKRALKARVRDAYGMHLVSAAEATRLLRKS